MTKRKQIQSLVISAVAVLMTLLLFTGITAFAQEPAAEAGTQETEMVTQAAEEETAAEAEPAEDAGEEKKSNPVMNVILVLIVVGAVFVCVREIHRDNHRK